MQGIRDVRNLFDMSIDDAFNSSYIKYESTGNKDKTLTIK